MRAQPAEQIGVWIKILTVLKYFSQSGAGLLHDGVQQLTGIAVNHKFTFAVSATYPSIHIWSLDGSYRFAQDLSAWVPGAGSTIVRKIVVTPAGDLLLLDTAAARVFRFRLHL